MKYIELYDSFYYDMCNPEGDALRWVGIPDANYLEFTTEESNKLLLNLKKIFNNWDITMFIPDVFMPNNTFSQPIKRENTLTINGWRKGHRSIENHFSMTISKLDDEWYKLMIIGHGSHRRFRCDQYDGLLKCLNDISKQLESGILIPDIVKLNENKDDSDKYYTKITEEDFDEATGRNVNLQGPESDFNIDLLSDFTNYEVSEIRKKFVGLYVYNEYQHYEYESKKDKIIKSVIRISDTYSKHFQMNMDWNGTIFYVVKLNDEWYYAMDFKMREYYKCDQWAGLKKLIDDLF
jgi:hypothetical protein